MDSVIIDYLVSKGYTPCEYIESSGAEYIDTGFMPNQDTRVVMDAQATIEPSPSVISCWFGARNTSTNCYFQMYDSSAVHTNVVFFYGSVYSKQFTIDWTLRHILEINKNTGRIDDESATYTTQTFEVGYSIYIGASNTNGEVLSILPMRLYSCQIYDNGTLIRDYVPAKDSSGYFGLYDLVNDEFYRSAAGNNFGGKPIIRGVQYVQNFRRRLVTSSNNMEVGYENQYFTIEALGSGYINWGNSNLDSYSNPIYYSKNGGGWVGSTEGSSVTVVSGDKVRFKTVRTGKPNINFGGTAKFNVYGNIMSLIHGDNFVGNNTLFIYAF